MTMLTRLKNEESGLMFSAVSTDKLGASEYTLVTIAIDVSGSVSSFKKELTDCIKTIVSSCKYSSRAENLMIRLITFNDTVHEEHGFSLLSSLNVDSYQNVVTPHGMTSLYDAMYDGLDAIRTYGNTLSEDDFDVNGIIFVVTDGEDNRSHNTATNFSNLINKINTEEKIESIRSILIGVNTSEYSIKQKLEEVKKTANIDQFVTIEKADENSLAKLASFISKSISAQSIALGTGGPSQALTF